jgi:hypothetical protein
MMMLQTTSGGSGNGPGNVSGNLTLAEIRTRLFGFPDTAVTFNDNQYVQNLNLLLQQELAGVSCYSKFSKASFISAAEYCDEHKEAGQHLERLVLANRGIPAARAASAASSFPRAILELCRAIPGEGPRKLVLTQFAQFEAQLLDRYDQILVDAPVGDAEVLRLLRNRCDRRLAAISLENI